MEVLQTSALPLGDGAALECSAWASRPGANLNLNTRSKASATGAVPETLTQSMAWGRQPGSPVGRRDELLELIA
jgi:hypothetical protein